MATACVSGSVLSSLFHEHSNSAGDQEGFLLGQINSHVKDTITDSQISGCKVETITNVYSFIPCPCTSTFYDRKAEINKPKLDALLQGRFKELVGWYRFRRNSTSRASLKEHSLHRKLVKLISGGQQEHFLFCLCTASTTTNISTHTFDHSFNVYIRGSFKCVPLVVGNLGDSVQNVYKNRNNMTVNHSAGVFSSLISQFIPEFTDEEGQIHEVKKMNAIAEKLQAQLQLLCSVANDSEKELEALDSEIAGIKSRLDSKREKERQKQPLPPSPIEDSKSFLPVDIHTSGPPPYADRQQKPSKSRFIPDPEFESTFIPSINEGKSLQLNQEQRGTTENHPNPSAISYPVKTGLGGVLQSMDMRIEGDNSESSHSPMIRTHSLPVKKKPDEPADHFSFIDSVLKEAKVSTPVRASSVRLLDQNRKSASLDDSRLSEQTSSSGLKTRNVQVENRDLNSSLADKNAPSTIDRNDRLRCKPVQRSRSRSLRSKSTEDHPPSVVILDDPSELSASGDKGVHPTETSLGIIGNNDMPSVTLNNSTVDKDNTKKETVTLSKKKTRTRAQVQAERAAAKSSVSATETNTAAVPSEKDLSSNKMEQNDCVNAEQEDSNNVDLVSSSGLTEVFTEGSSSPVY